MFRKTLFAKSLIPLYKESRNVYIKDICPRNNFIICTDNKENMLFVSLNNSRYYKEDFRTVMDKKIELNIFYDNHWLNSKYAGSVLFPFYLQDVQTCSINDHFLL